MSNIAQPSGMTDSAVLGSAGISAVGALIGGAMDLISNYATNKQNLAIQEKQWAREDNAYQRLAKDLEKAGYSKNILSGVSSGSSSSSTFRAQKGDYGFLSDSIDKGLSKYMMYEQLRLQQESQKAQVAYQNKTVEQVQAQIDHLNLQNKALEDKLDYYKKLGIPEGVMSNDLTKLGLHNLGLDLSNTLPFGKIDLSNIDFSKMVKDVLDWSTTSKSGIFKTIKDSYPDTANKVKNWKMAIIDFLDGVILGNKNNSKYWKKNKK